MGKKLGIIIGVVVTLAIIGVGAFFIIKNISDENHKKDIEMAADCARSFEVPEQNITWDSNRNGFSDNGFSETVRNNRNAKREECASKYHVTHQEIIDKIGTADYMPR